MQINIDNNSISAKVKVTEVDVTDLILENLSKSEKTNTSTLIDLLDIEFEKKIEFLGKQATIFIEISYQYDREDKEASTVSSNLILSFDDENHITCVYSDRKLIKGIEDYFNN